MPGRLIMNAQHQAHPGQPDQLHTQTRPPQKTQDAFVVDRDQDKAFITTDLAATNGSTPTFPASTTTAKDGASHARHGSLPNGIAHHVESTTNAAEGVLPPSTPFSGGDEAPPSLRSWTDSYVPFGTILQRLAQHTFNDLHETIDRLADKQPTQHVQQPQSLQTNGLSLQSTSTVTTTDTSKSSVEKKLILLDFAQRHKDRFIKTLVLAAWGRDMDQMNRLIELTMWLRNQDNLGHLAADAIVALKQVMIQAKMPNPNIEGALEVLSSGSAPWMPKLGYIPPKPLTTQQILKTFKDIEFNLFTRLNLHEDLPAQFHDFSIANGRATFTVQNEFELDVAAAHEDPASPLYFIDFRLLCRPDSFVLPDGSLRHHLEAQVNNILATTGLRACYEFLHDYTLTFQLSRLRTEASQLARNKWAGELQVQQVHRSLIVHYWINAPGPKNWFEIGVLSDKQATRGSTRHQPLTRLSCRWFRNAQEFYGHSLDTSLEDIQSLAAESLLEQIVARHISGRLSEISRRLTIWSEGTSGLSQKLETSDLKPLRCALAATLHGPSTTVNITIEPITAKYCISPPGMAQSPSHFSSVAEAAGIYRQLICDRYLQCLTVEAQSIGFNTLNSAQIESGETQDKHGCQTRLFSAEQIGLDWALSVKVSLRSREWCLVSLTSHVKGLGARETHQLLSSLVSDRLPHDRLQLIGLAEYSVARLSFLVLTDELRASHIPYEARSQPQASNFERNAFTVCNLPIDKLVAVSAAITNSDVQLELWCLNILEVRHIGLQKSSGPVVHVITGALTSNGRRRFLGSLEHEHVRASGLSVSNDGIVQVTVKTSLGEPILAAVRSRLCALERLSAYIAAASRHGFAITMATLDQFTFRYSSQPALFAQVQSPLANSDLSSSELRLGLFVGHPGSRSLQHPQHRLLDELQGKLNNDMAVKDTSSGDIALFIRCFDELCQALRLTLPVMQTLSAMEADSAVGRVMYNCHSATSFRLSYKAPLPEYTFIISAKVKDGQCFWLVQERRRRQGLSESVNTQLAETWSSRGKGWTGLRNGAAASIDGVSELLLRLDSILRKAAGETAAPAKAK